MGATSLRFLQVVIFLNLFVVPQTGHALSLDANVFYMSDSLSVATDITSTRLFWDFAVTIDLDKKGYWILGWAYNSLSISESGATSSEFSLTEMGPKLGYYFDKNKVWSACFTYNFQSNADYSSAGSSAEWRGTSMKGELGFTPAFTESFHAGVKLNYYQANFSEQFVSGTTFSTISNSRSMIYPTIAFIYRFL